MSAAIGRFTVSCFSPSFLVEPFFQRGTVKLLETNLCGHLAIQMNFRFLGDGIVNYLHAKVPSLQRNELPAVKKTLLQLFGYAKNILVFDFKLEDCKIFVHEPTSPEYYGQKKKVQMNPAGSFCNPDIPALMAFAEPSLFGKGEETLLDLNIRKSYDVVSEKLDFNCGENELQNVLQQKFTPEVGEQVFRKMDIYRPGDFFVSHRDNVRSYKHLASLVVVLPVAHTGGELVMHFDDESHYEIAGPAEPDLSDTDGSERNNAQVIAFYSDVQHEVKPVISGARVTLTYDIMRKDIEQDYRDDISRDFYRKDLNVVEEEQKQKVIAT